MIISKLLRGSVAAAALVVAGCSSSEPQAGTEAPPETDDIPATQFEALPDTRETSLDDIASSPPTHVVANDEAAEKFLTSIPVNSSEEIEHLRTSLGNAAPAVLENLDQTMNELETGSDLNALKYLAKLRAASLTNEQAALALKVRDMVSAVVLERNFAAAAGAASGDLGRTLEAIRERDVAGVISGLRSLSSSATLTNAQKALIQSLIADYAPDVAEAGRSVPKGLKKMAPMGN